MIMLWHLCFCQGYGLTQEQRRLSRPTPQINRLKWLEICMWLVTSSIRGVNIILTTSIIIRHQTPSRCRVSIRNQETLSFIISRQYMGMLWNLVNIQCYGLNQFKRCAATCTMSYMVANYYEPCLRQCYSFLFFRWQNFL